MNLPFCYIICITFSPIKHMIGDCFCLGSLKRSSLNTKSKYYKVISSCLQNQQISILTLIYDDLASRNQQNKLTYQNFLSFFDLAGLWGAKLFKQFDQDGMQLITFEEFLYGISLTAKAPFQDKIKLLYNFFEDDIANGIQFKDFVKMLYNYSKQELKQILIEDGFVQKSQASSCGSDIGLNSSQKVFQLNAKQNTKKAVTAFDQAYEALLHINQEGTYLEINQKDLKYKIKYCNMNTLVKQFAEKVYAQHGIDVHSKTHKFRRLTYQNFSSWIKSHKKLFKSYFSAFHTEIWTLTQDQLSYMREKVDLQFTGKIQCAKLKCDVYGFQLQDVIIFCQSRKNKKKPIKIVCLQGLSIKDAGNLRIQIAHVSDWYKNIMMIFDKESDHKLWLQNLKIYQRESLNNNYNILEMIGTGKYSVVYKCIQKSTSKFNALKVIQLQKLTENARRAISNQSQILKVLNHPQIVKYVDTIYTKSHEYILTEYIYGQDLFEYVRKRKYLNQFESAFIIGNIMKAVMYLHQLDIMHRDLKPENIMVMFKEKKQGEYFECTTPEIRKGQRIQNIKVIDFGLSNHMNELNKMDPKQRACGTPNYIAPEILYKLPPTLKSDVFSIGSILYFLLRGILPFAELDNMTTFVNTCAGNYDIQSQHWDNISDQAKDLLQRLLEVEPDKRIQLKQAVNHEWFNLIFNQTKSKSSAGSVSDTNQTIKKSSSVFEDMKAYDQPRTRKVSTSESKYKDYQKSRHSK